MNLRLDQRAPIAGAEKIDAAVHGSPGDIFLFASRPILLSSREFVARQIPWITRCFKAFSSRRPSSANRILRSKLSLQDASSPSCHGVPPVSVQKVHDWHSFCLDLVFLSFAEVQE
jgi:hypothetical protein